MNIVEFGLEGENQDILFFKINEQTKSIITIEKRLAPDIWAYHTGKNFLSYNAEKDIYEFKIDDIISVLDNNETEIFDIYGENTDCPKKQLQIINLSIKNFKFSSNSGRTYEFSFYKNASGGLSLSVKNKYIATYEHNSLPQNAENENKIKIVVIGSCFSRQAFRSEEFYNPDYKKFYEVGLTYYHVSIPSMVSDKIDYNVKDFENSANQKDLLKYGEDSFKKDFFEKIKEYNPDYILIENYSSITNHLIETEGTKYIDNNYYLKNTNVLKKLKDSRMISNSSREFFEIYKKSLDKFRESLKEIFNLEHIILLKAQPSLTKIEDGKIMEWENLQVIKMRRYLWEKFDNYFESKFPEAKIANLRYDKYISEKISGMEFQSNHLNQQYYRDEINEINKIVLYDLLNKK